jgi:heat shock protein HtpX
MRFWGGGRDNEHPLMGLATLILGPLAASFIQLAISRSREFNADKEGANIVGDPMYLATALEKIHRLNRRIPTDVSPAFNSMFIAEPRNLWSSAVEMFQTHPSLQKRLMNLIGRPSTGMTPAAAETY